MKDGQRIGCVVVAAGRGVRAGLGYNKAFYPLGGRSVLSRTLDALSGGGCIDELVLVLSEDDFDSYEKLTAREGRNPLVARTVKGGSTRQASAHNGLRALSADVDIALVHDAARPFVSREMIEAVLDGVAQCGAAVISTLVSDTVKEANAQGFAVRTPERASLRAVQTPQGFRLGEILEAYDWAERERVAATDDASLYEKRFGPVLLVTTPDAGRNVKMTTQEDFVRAEASLCPPRAGMGYDVHRLAEGRRLVLMGVEVPWEKGLLGHSDADVALHALMDAMLGALALGDIGHLFPDNDDRYLGISSLSLLETVRDRVAEKGYRVGNADVTIICQRPKLAPYIGEMRETTARALGIPADCVSVKATTTEGLGFEGEGAGIAAQAVVLLVKGAC